MKRCYVFFPLLISCLIFSGNALGQETTQNYEIGFRTSGLSRFDIIYKKQKAENSFSRLRLITSEIDIPRLAPFNGSFSLGLAGGRENRKPLSEKLFFVTGFELMCTFRTALASDKLSIYLTPGIGAVLGFTYLASDKVLVGFETIPAASFKIGYSNHDFGITDFYMIASSYASLFIVYRFSK